MADDLLPKSAATRAGTLKVMHILYMLRMGGTENGVVKIANGLFGAGVVSSICSCQPADALKHRLRAEVRLFEFNRRNRNDPWFVLQLARLLRRERPDIVHTHSWGTLCEGLIAARIAGVPRVVHGEHGTMEMRSWNLRVQRLAWERADCVLSVSSRLAEKMAHAVRYPVDRIRVIRNGLDTTRFSPARREAARRRLGIAPDALVIGTVGRLVPVKDQAGLLRALALLKAQHTKFRAVIAGDGPLRTDLVALAASLGLDDRVEFIGERTDVEDVLASFDIFVLSSVSEGLSNTILEAMASGVPVIATRVGGAEELVDDGRTGLLIQPSSVEQLAEALHRLALSLSEREEMGRAGRLRAEHAFALPVMLAGYESLYRELATGRALEDAPCVA